MRIAWPELVAVAAIGLVAIESADKPRGVAVAQAARSVDGDPRADRPALLAPSAWPRTSPKASGGAVHAVDAADPHRHP